MIVVVGCGIESVPPPSPTEPATIEIAVPPEVVLCEGTKAWALSEATRITTLTGLEPTFPLTVELGVTAVGRACGEAPAVGARLGCTTGSGGQTRAFAEPAAFAHELTHALRRQSGLSTVPFFEEGFAEAVNGSAVHPSVVFLEASDLTVDPPRLVRSGEPLVGAGPYRVATHMMRWMFERYGEAEVAAFVRGGIDRDGDDALARFASVFGESFADATVLWRDAAASVTVRGRPCSDAKPLDPTGDSFSATLDCSEATTFGLVGPRETNWQRICFSVASTREVELSLEADAGLAILDVATTSCAVAAGDPSRRSQQLEPGQRKRVTLAPCEWSVTFIGGQAAPLPMRLQITAD